MYIPKQYQATNRPEMVAFMQQYSFATIVTAKDTVPVATHLPFSVIEKNGELLLSSHFAKANPQWEHLEQNNVLVIFSEPHAYISPKHYDKEQSVPTWNYVAVHAYGKARLITTDAEAYATLESMIDSYDIDYKKQWDTLPQEFKNKMLKGIVAFEIIVTELLASKKLSQNKTAAEQKRIIDTLANSEYSGERAISELMKNNLP